MPRLTTLCVVPNDSDHPEDAAPMPAEQSERLHQYVDHKGLQEGNWMLCLVGDRYQAELTREPYKQQLMIRFVAEAIKMVMGDEPAEHPADESTP